MQHGMTEQNV